MKDLASLMCETLDKYSLFIIIIFLMNGGFLETLLLLGEFVL